MRGSQMNRDYDDELERRMARRPRRDPENRNYPAGGPSADRNGQSFRSRREEDAVSQREKWESRKQQNQEEKELDVLGDASVYVPPRRTSGERQGESRARGAESRAKGTESRRETAWRSEKGSGQGRSRSSLSGGESARSIRLRQQQERRKKRRRMIAMVVAECFALLFIFGYGFYARTVAHLQRDPEFIQEEIQSNDLGVEFEEQMKGYWTIAVFGVDARDSAISKDTHSDVIMLCNINLDTGEIKLASVYRDTYLNINKNGSYNKINQAYFDGGPTQAVEALNRNLDLKIWDYVTFNWKAVAQAIDILGGVDIELSKAEFHYINGFITETVKATGIGSHQLTHAGMNHLDGVQAVAYGRLRLMDTDYARTERQRKVVEQAFEKCKKADFDTLYRLIGTVFPNVKTSLWVDDLVNNAKNISKFHLGETTGFPQARGDASMPKKGSVVVPATLETNVARLHEFLFGTQNYQPSDTVKSISQKIASDTGITKEGQYIDKVGTSGGVIQQPKTTPAATENEEDEDEGYQYVYVRDKNGKKVKKRLEMETDEDGEYIPYETDSDGFLVEESSAERPTAPVETDENGNPIETTQNPLLPPVLETDEDGNVIYPTDEDGNILYPTRPTRPGSETEPSESGISRPGAGESGPDSTGGQNSHRPGAGDETTSGNSVVDRPGGTAAEPSSGVVNRPGDSIAPTSGGNNGEVRPTAPAPSQGPTAPTAATTAPVRPTAPSETMIPGGPGETAVITPPEGGPVSAPGQ